MRSGSIALAFLQIVIGATGGVGSAAVQIGKWKGARVLKTVRHVSDLEFAHQIGVDRTIDLSTQDLCNISL